MEKITQERRPVSAEVIAKMADRGENVLRFFIGKGEMMPPIPIKTGWLEGRSNSRDQFDTLPTVDGRETVRSLNKRFKRAFKTAGLQRVTERDKQNVRRDPRSDDGQG